MTEKEKEEEGYLIGLVEDFHNIEEFIITNQKEIKGMKFPFGYATVRIRDELKSYFAIQVAKELNPKIDEKSFKELIGEIFFFMEYDKDSILYLRTKVPLDFIKIKNNKENTFSNSLNKR